MLVLEEVVEELTLDDDELQLIDVELLEILPEYETEELLVVLLLETVCELDDEVEYEEEDDVVDEDDVHVQDVDDDVDVEYDIDALALEDVEDEDVLVLTDVELLLLDIE